MTNKRWLLLFIVFCASSCALAQKTSWQKNIQGLAFVEQDISPNEAKKLAIEDAKQNALKAAGVEEIINQHTISSQAETQAKGQSINTKAFAMSSFSEMQGAILEYELIKEDAQKSLGSSNMQYNVWINAKVVKYDKTPDPTFTARVEGIKPSYANNDNLYFSVTPSWDAYLTVFCIGEKEASVLYPSAYDQIQILKANVTYHFPLIKVDYALENKLGKDELNRLFVVLTKTQIPFVYKETEAQILKWIFEINPDQRRVEMRTFTLMK